MGYYLLSCMILVYISASAAIHCQRDLAVYHLKAVELLRTEHELT
jgi:hypothetical protein